MEMNIKQRGNVQIIYTFPDGYTPKRGHNQATEALRDRERVEKSPIKYQKIVQKKNRSFNKLMNCKTVDKFDHGTHPDYPKAKSNTLRAMKRGEVKAYCLAGAEIQYDPWTFVRKVVYQNRVLGSCSKSDIETLVRDGVVHQVYDQNGHLKYVR